MIITPFFILYLCIANHIFGELFWMDWIGLAIIVMLDTPLSAIKTYDTTNKLPKTKSICFDPKKRG